MSVDNVLVLCQRKNGPMPPGEDGNVEEIEIPEIIEFVHDFFILYHNDKKYFDSHSSPEIEYLSDKIWNDDTLTEKFKINDKEYPALSGYVDYQLRLAKGFPDVDEFVKNHTYNLIVLQQCPLARMEYDLISKLLKHDGRIAIIRTPDFQEAINRIRYTTLPMAYKESNILQYFVEDTDKKYENMIIFKPLHISNV